MNWLDSQLEVVGRTFTPKEIESLMISKDAINRIVGICAACAVQLQSLGIRIRRMTLKSGEKALVALDKEFGVRIIPTVPVNFETKILISFDEYEMKRMQPSAVMDGSEMGELFPRMCSICPAQKKKGAEGKEGQWEIIPIKIKVEGFEVSSVLMPVLPVGRLLTPIQDLTSAGMEGMQVISPTVSNHCETVNFLTRSLEYSEATLMERCFRTKGWAGMITSLYPRSFTIKGKVIHVWGELLDLLVGKDGLYRQHRDVRAPGGGSLILMTDVSMLKEDVFSCKMPRSWMQEHGYQLGDYVMGARRPACKMAALQIIGYSKKSMICHPLLIKSGWISDCDGDLIQMWPVPKGTDIGQINSLFNLQSEEPKEEAFFPTDFAGANYLQEALNSHLRNKILMGPFSAIRFVMSLWPEMNNIRLDDLQFNHAPYEEILGRPLHQMKPVSTFGFTDLFHKMSEDAINKHIDLSTGDEDKSTYHQMVGTFNLAQGNPLAAWKLFSAQGGNMAKDLDLLAYWMEYLHTLPMTVEEMLQSPPNSLHEGKSRQSISSVLANL